MSTPQKVSFKTPGASAAPTIDAETGKPAEAATPVDVSAALAPRPADGSVVPATPPSGSYFGGEEEVDAEDIRFPYVNLVQPTSKSPLIDHGVGNYVLAKDTKLGNSFTAVVVGFSKPRYEEKVKWGAPQGKRFHSIEEVHAFGGTTRWADSRENRDGSSKRPFFDTQRTALLLIEHPAGERKDAAGATFTVPDDRFIVTLDGKQYSIALFVCKGMGYDPVYVNLNSEQKNGTLREGFYTRFVSFGVAKASATSEAVKPTTRVDGKVGEQVKAKALELRS